MRPLPRLLLPVLIAIVGCYAPETPAEDDSGSASGKADDPDSGDDGEDVTGDACDPFAQDCGDGFKCNPYADDGGNSWNANMCVPVDPSPRAIGQSCTIEGEGVSGFDDCEAGATCSNGECVALCGGDEYEPTCGGANEHCAIFNSGALPICVETCDPLAQDCGGNEGCYSDPTSFSCWAQGGSGAGEVCNFLNDCRPGLGCAKGDNIPGCAGESCCAPHCDLYTSGTCAPGETCAHWDLPSEAADGVEHVGACVVIEAYGTCIEGECADPLNTQCLADAGYEVCAPDCDLPEDCPAGPAGEAASCVPLGERRGCVFTCDVDGDCPAEKSCHGGVCLN